MASLSDNLRGRGFGWILVIRSRTPGPTEVSSGSTGTWAQAGIAQNHRLLFAASRTIIGFGLG